ncbi:MAG: hypothetical protein ACOVLB_07125 [Candidatus Nanopelagicus sp.]
MTKLATTDRQANLARSISKIPNNASAKKTLIYFYTKHMEDKIEMENEPTWANGNLEFDLRSSEYIVEKCQDKMYAQNLYAALCNNDFRQNDVVPILLEETWGCTWRYAGGIVADLRQEGDYIDWYCSGIREEEDVESPEQSRPYIHEGYVTDEIRDDLFKIGWIVVDE